MQRFDTYLQFSSGETLPERSVHYFIALPYGGQWGNVVSHPVMAIEGVPVARFRIKPKPAKKRWTWF